MLDRTSTETDAPAGFAKEQRVIASTPRHRAVVIMNEECVKRGVSIAELRSSFKSVQLYGLRARIARRIAVECGLSPRAIGEVIGRERTTVAYYLNKEMRERKSASRKSYARAKREAAQ